LKAIQWIAYIFQGCSGFDVEFKVKPARKSAFKAALVFGWSDDAQFDKQTSQGRQRLILR
jgi:hypothetical protein